MDMLVDGRVIVENKTVERVLPIHVAQTITYLKLSGYLPEAEWASPRFSSQLERQADEERHQAPRKQLMNVYPAFAVFASLRFDSIHREIGAGRTENRRPNREFYFTRIINRTS